VKCSTSIFFLGAPAGIDSAFLISQVGLGRKKSFPGAEVAQLAEHSPEKAGVDSSILSLGTTFHASIRVSLRLLHRRRHSVNDVVNVTLEPMGSC
jgi:hypothetical protein